MTKAWIGAPPAPSPRDGPEAFGAALALVGRGQKVSPGVRAALVRAFGRQPLVRALWAIERSAMLITEAEPGLYLSAPHDRALAGLKRIFPDAWTCALATFGDEPPLLLVQHPAVFGPRLAVTPAVGIAFIQFPLFPAEGPEEADRAARHEMCHAFCWSGRRFLDEGLADRFAGGVGEIDDGDRHGPSTRALLEAENGSDLHLERHADDAVAALRLRRRGAALAGELVERLGWKGVRALCEDLLCRSGPEVADRIESVLQEPLTEWDRAQAGVASDPLSCARERLIELEKGGAVPGAALLRELDGFIRDARRQGTPASETSELLARRVALGVGGGGLKALSTHKRVAAATANAAAWSDAEGPLRAGGVGLRLGQVSLQGGADFRLQVDGMSFRPGERVGLIGANGSGKSTLLSWIASGRSSELTFNDISSPEWVRKGRNRAKLGVSLSEFPYHPSSRVREVLELHRAVYGAPDPHVAAAFDMRPHANARLSELSKGWRQILSLYFAFAHNPELVLLDEPSLGLDDTHARALRVMLDPRTNGRKQTILVATHIGADLEGLDRIVVLAHGAVAANGRVGDLLNAYGQYKAFVIDPCATAFADELRALPGLRGFRRGEGRLRLYGSAEFSSAFTALAVRLSLSCFGVEPATTDDILTFAMEI